MRLLYTNRPSTVGKSLSPQRRTSTASDVVQLKFLIQSYIQLRFINLARHDSLLLGFLAAPLLNFQGFWCLTWSFTVVPKEKSLYSYRVKQSALFRLLISSAADATFFRDF
jgi:hypothetical protein